VVLLHGYPQTAKQAMENMEYVCRLLGQKQPGFAASLVFAVSLAETSMEKRWTVN